MNINILRKPTPAAPSTYQYVTCGSGYDYGICPTCKRGHGYIIFQRPKKTKSPTKEHSDFSTSLFLEI